MSDKKEKTDKVSLLITTIIVFILSLLFVSWLLFYSAVYHEEIPFNDFTKNICILGCIILVVFLYCVGNCIAEFFPQKFEEWTNPICLSKELEKLKIDETDLFKILNDDEVHLDKRYVEVKKELMKIAKEDTTSSAKIVEYSLTMLAYIFVGFLIPIYDFIYTLISGTPKYQDSKDLYFNACSATSLVLVIMQVVTATPRVFQGNKSEITHEKLPDLGLGYFYKDRESITILSMYVTNSVEWTNEGVTDGYSTYKEVPKLFKFTIIGENAFKGFANLKYVKIPNTIRIIKQNAFSGCTSLDNLIIPNSVVEIGDNAFLGVKNVIYNGTAKGAPWKASSVN